MRRWALVPAVRAGICAGHRRGAGAAVAPAEPPVHQRWLAMYTYVRAATSTPMQA